MMPTWNSVSATVLAAVVSFGVSAEAASAQTLFDMLFGGKRIRQVERERPAPPPKPKPVALPKVSAPSFYNYKPESLARVDFAPVLAAEAPPKTSLSWLRRFAAMGKAAQQPAADAAAQVKQSA